MKKQATGKEGDKVWVWLHSRNAIVRGVLTQDHKYPYSFVIKPTVANTMYFPPELVSFAASKKQASEELRKAIQKDIKERTKFGIERLQPILDAACRWGVRSQFVIIRR